MAVSSLSIDQALAQQTKTDNAGSKLAGDFTQFLTLLTIQLQNQDPLSPMDTTEFTNQLVNFSQVEQQINANQKLDNLVALNLNNALSNSLSYVGMDVSYLSAEFHYQGAGPVKINYALEGQAIEAKMRIYDEEGDLVMEKEITKTAGSNDFIWDGKDTLGATVPQGTYNIKIAATDIDGNAVSASTVVQGRVHGVETQNGLIFVLVGERAVPVGSILNANEAPDADPPA